MPQLDRLITVLASHRGEALRLTDGRPATLLKQGGAHAITKQPLSATQVLAIVREVAPADAARQLDAGMPAEFRYLAPDGAYDVRAARADGRWQVDVTGAAGESAPARATPAVNGAAHATPTGATRVSVNGSHMAAPSPAARAEMDALLREMASRRASDLHLRCGEPPLLRLDGDIVRFNDRAPLANEQLEAMLAAIMPPQNRAGFAETGDTDFAYELAGVARFRANALRERKGAAAVFRLIPATVVTVEQMGLSAEVQQLCHLSKGLVLVTGPTGSGKSTTLCALIDLINRSRSDHIIAIEDPIEFVHENRRCLITQRQVGTHTQGFKQALRAALREDPDIVLVGELRDLETTAIAIETAETGHLVLGTLHTTTAPSTIDRIIDQFPADRQSQIRTMLSESLRGVISQTLCKKIGGGRVAAREVLLSTAAISNLIREGKTYQIASVLQTSKRQGMVTLNDALLELVESGQVEPAEAYLKAVDKSSLAATFKARGFDTSFAEADGSSGTRAAPATLR